MAFQLTDVVPWGRTFAEYAAMFALDDLDRSRSILGCSDGPASFNAEALQRNIKVVSADPLYQFSVPQIRKRIAETAPTVAAQVKANAQDFVWNHFKSVNELVAARMKAMQTFLADFNTGLEQGRYVPAQLPPYDLFLSAGLSKAEAFAPIDRAETGISLGRYYGQPIEIAFREWKRKWRSCGKRLPRSRGSGRRFGGSSNRCEEWLTRQADLGGDPSLRLKGGSVQDDSLRYYPRLLGLTGSLSGRLRIRRLFASRSVWAGWRRPSLRRSRSVPWRSRR